MVVKRRKRRVTRIVNLRKYLGGYMDSKNWVPQPMDKTYLNAAKASYAEKHKDKKIGGWDYFNWYKLADKYANRNVMEEDVMNEILTEYKSGNFEDRERTLDKLKDHLIIRDININPEDYLREWEKGKHRKNKWAKWAGGAAEVVALIAAAYGLSTMGTGVGLGSLGNPFTKMAGTAALKKGIATGMTEAELKELAEKYTGHMAEVGTSASSGPLNTNLIDFSKYNSEGIVKGLYKMLIGSLNKADNKGLAGVGDKLISVVGDKGAIIEIPHNEFHTWAINHPGDFEGYLKAFNSFMSRSSPYQKGMFQRAYEWWTGSGAGYHVTRKGRRLIKRYRRHLRHKRRRF